MDYRVDISAVEGMSTSTFYYWVSFLIKILCHFFPAVSHFSGIAEHFPLQIKQIPWLMHLYFNGAMRIYSNSGSLVFHLVFSPWCCTPFFCLLMCNNPFAFAFPWCFPSPRSDLLWSTSIFDPENTLLGAEERSGKQEPW